MTCGKEQDNISLLKLRRPGKTKFVLEESYWSTRTSQRMDSLDSHEILALAHIANPEAVTERVASKSFKIPERGVIWDNNF